MIERGTPLPTVRSETFFTSVENQRQIDARIFQGESPDVRHNLLDGRFWVDDLPPLPELSPVVFKLGLGLDGILDVEVMEPSSGLTQHPRFEEATARLDPEQLVAARQRTQALWGEREPLDPTAAAADASADGMSTTEAGQDDAEWVRDLPPASRGPASCTNR